MRHFLYNPPQMYFFTVFVALASFIYAGYTLSTMRGSSAIDRPRLERTTLGASYVGVFSLLLGIDRYNTIGDIYSSPNYVIAMLASGGCLMIGTGFAMALYRRHWFRALGALISWPSPRRYTTPTELRRHYLAPRLASLQVEGRSTF